MKNQAEQHTITQRDGEEMAWFLQGKGIGIKKGITVQELYDQATENGYKLTPIDDYDDDPISLWWWFVAGCVIVVLGCLVIG